MIYGGKVKLAVLFARLGPYHHARLRAVGSLCDLTAIELSAFDNTYAWEQVNGAEGFVRMTLFRDKNFHEKTIRETHAAVWQALDSSTPNVVAVPGWSSQFALSAISWCRFKNIPAILMSDSQSIDEPRVWWKEWIKTRVVSQFSVGFVAGSRHKDYLRMLSMSCNKIFTGYDVVDNEHFLQGAERVRYDMQKQRTQLDLPEQFFLKCSRFVEKKNISRLIEAYAIYQKQAGVNAWHLVIVGDGPLRPQLEEQISILGLVELVHLPGFIQYDELPYYYGLANVYIQASITEQWGLVVNEAMASGLPVLVSKRCGCAPDLVQEGVNGYTFDPSNVSELAGLMTKIANQDSELADMGQESCRIITRWSPEKFAQSILKATEVAISLPLSEISMFDRLVLKGLSYR